ANASSCAGPLDRRVAVGDLHHPVCKSHRISPAIRAREVFATERGQTSAVVVETTDSRVEDAHSEVEMDVACASASSLACQARGGVLLCDHGASHEPPRALASRLHGV